MMDRIGEYKWIFYACSVNVATAGLFLMASFFYLDRQRAREAKESCTPPPDHQQPSRPMLALTVSDTDANPLPLLQAQQTQDLDGVNVSEV